MVSLLGVVRSRFSHGSSNANIQPRRETATSSQSTAIDPVLVQIDEGDEFDLLAVLGSFFGWGKR